MPPFFKGKLPTDCADVLVDLGRGPCADDDIMDLWIVEGPADGYLGWFLIEGLGPMLRRARQLSS